MLLPGPLRRALVVAGALLAALLVPAVALAHPLGNFTINHFTGVRVGLDAIVLDVVIDRAEIPAFAAVPRLDSDGDGMVSSTEAQAAGPEECRTLAADLRLTAGGERLTLVPTAAGLAVPPGAGGLPTLRTVCTYRAALPGRLAPSTGISFEDAAFAERPGWREIVVTGDGTTVVGDLMSRSVSARLTSYPPDLLSVPPATRAVAFEASPGGPSLAPFVALDAAPIDGAVGATPSPDGAALEPAVVPGGIGAELAPLGELVGTTDLSPLVVLAAIGLSMALGAGHALTPGHGKTIMAAYLVGTRGGVRQAVGLGLAVAVSHTLGIAILAMLIGLGGAALPPERFALLARFASAVILVAMGAWMVAGQIRTRWIAIPRALATAAVPGPPGHQHLHPHPRGSGHVHPHPLGLDDRGHPLGPDHVHPHGQAHPPTWTVGDDPAAAALSWRGLAALGLAGGIVPSTSALLILLATVAVGQLAYGIVLVGAFGVGMALVLGGIGLALVLGRDAVERAGAASASVGRVLELAPAVASFAVLGIGLWLTAQAIPAAGVIVAR